MPLMDHYRGATVEKMLVTVITSDPATNRVEVVGRDAAVIQVNMGASPPLLRWPSEGELWTIVRQNGLWQLDQVIENPEAVKQIRDLLAGEALIQANKIWTPSGEHVILSGELEDEIFAHANDTTNIHGITNTADLLHAIGGFIAVRTTNITGLAAGWNPLVFNSDQLDVSGWRNPSDGRYTPQRPGLYLIGAHYHLASVLESGARFTAGLRINGTDHNGVSIYGNGVSTELRVDIIKPQFFNGSTDWVQGAINHSGATNQTVSTDSYFWGFYLGTI